MLFTLNYCHSVWSSSNSRNPHLPHAIFSVQYVCHSWSASSLQCRADTHKGNQAESTGLIAKCGLHRGATPSHHMSNWVYMPKGEMQPNLLNHSTSPRAESIPHTKMKFSPIHRTTPPHRGPILVRTISTTHFHILFNLILPSRSSKELFPTISDHPPFKIMIFSTPN